MPVTLRVKLSAILCFSLQNPVILAFLSNQTSAPAKSFQGMCIILRVRGMCSRIACALHVLNEKKNRFIGSFVLQNKQRKFLVGEQTWDAIGTILPSRERYLPLFEFSPDATALTVYVSMVRYFFL